MKWAKGVSVDEMGESGWPALCRPHSPWSPGELELQEDLGLPHLCLSGLLPEWGPASGHVF